MAEIGYGGDNCSDCPRYVATINNDTEKLKEAALMWKRVGWRDTVLNIDEIKCGGCKTVKWCRYNDITCRLIATGQLANCINRSK